jgi:endonuclease III
MTTGHPFATRLFSDFYTRDGIFGSKMSDMPYRKYLCAIPAADRLPVLTVTTVMDYQTSAERLWNAALETYRDEETHWLFDLAKLAAAEPLRIKQAMLRHGFTGTFPNINSDYIQRVAQSIVTKWAGVPELVSAFGNDARRLYDSRKQLGDLPSLGGDKVFPLWLRTVAGSGTVELLSLDRIPIPVDVHIARASYRLLYDSGEKPEPQRLREKIESDWKAICDIAEVPGMMPVAMYEPLWFLSHNGCSGSDARETCKRLAICPVAEWCHFAIHTG